MSMALKGKKALLHYLGTWAKNLARGLKLKSISVSPSVISVSHETEQKKKPKLQ